MYFPQLIFEQKKTERTKTLGYFNYYISYLKEAKLQPRSAKN